jgi:alpha-tubulin suppressor-like RCC1 family protein
MTTINVSNLIIILQQKINSTVDEKDLLYYSKALDQLKTGKIYVISKFSDLPDYTKNSGKIFYVIDDELIYIVVNENGGWTPIYDKEINALFSWGNGDFGALGDGTSFTNSCSPVRECSSARDWCKVSGGIGHVLAIKLSGQIWAWGDGSSGRLGDGTASARCSPVREICSSTDWYQVSAGGCHSTAIKTSGQIWSWGANAYGQLGDGTDTTRCSPVREFCSATDWCQISGGFRYHTTAIKNSGQLWTWGFNNCGQLGDGTATSRCSPVREFCSGTDWCQVSGGGRHTSAIKTSGQIWVWGSNSCGQLGDGTVTQRCSPVRERSSATDWCQVSAGSMHTAAIKTSGQLWSWGNNSYAPGLGDGTATNRCSPVREFCSATDWCQVSAGWYGVSAIKTSGQLWAWGNNGFGQLGDGTTFPRCSPVREITSLTNWCQLSTNRRTSAIKIICVN